MHGLHLRVHELHDAVTNAAPDAGVPFVLPSGRFGTSGCNSLQSSNLRDRRPYHSV